VPNASYIAEICRRLDGLPLAIELAAARIVLLPPQALLARLSSRLKLLTRGAQNLPERQQTLRNAIAWSYDLLTPAEQRLFRRLAVFAGSWVLEAAESVCAAPAEATLPGPGILDELESLMEKNLVRRQESAGVQDVYDEEPRFGMLETIHEYALEQLDASEETETLRKAHATYYLTLTEEAEPALAAKEQRTWLERLEQEHDNLRAALAWARERRETAIGLRMAGALNLFWQIRGYLSEGLGWLVSLLALPADPKDADEAMAAVRAKALLSASGLASWMDDYVQAIALAETSLALYRRLGDKQGIASALSALGGMASLQGDTARAMALDEECLRLQRELGNTRGLAIALGNLGTTMRALGDDARAETLFSESLSLFRQLGDQMAIATRLYSLATVAQKLGDYARASALYEESLDLRRQLGDRQHIADSLQGMADIALIQGDHKRARALYVESLTESRNLGYKLVFVGNLEGLAAVASAEAQPARAARLFGAAEALRAAIGAPSYFPGGRAIYDQTLTTLRAALGETAWASSLAAGHNLSVEQAITEALET
jgi:tetratricopeptide (TPR) repeat protein